MTVPTPGLPGKPAAAPAAGWATRPIPVLDAAARHGAE